jgi:hypothetical protein
MPEKAKNREIGRESRAKKATGCSVLRGKVR